MVALSSLCHCVRFLDVILWYYDLDVVEAKVDTVFENCNELLWILVQKEWGPPLGKRTLLDFSIWLKPCSTLPGIVIVSGRKVATFSDFIYTVIETRQLNYPNCFTFCPTLHFHPIQFWSIALVCCCTTLEMIIWIDCSSMSIVVNTFSWQTGCFGDDSLNPGIALVVSVSCVAIYEAGVKWSPSRQCRHMLSIASAHSSTTEHKRIPHQKAHQRDCDIMWYYNSYALYIWQKSVQANDKNGLFGSL